MAKIYDSYINIQKFKSKNLHKNRNSKKTKGCRRKNYSFNGGAIKRGGVKGQAIKEKRTFLTPFFSSIPMFQRPLSSRGVGG